MKPTTVAHRRLLENIARERQTTEEARARFLHAIHDALAAGLGPSEISRASGFTREYIAKIRDGKGPRA